LYITIVETDSFTGEGEFDDDFIYNPAKPLALRLEPLANFFRRFYAIHKTHRRLFHGEGEVEDDGEIVARDVKVAAVVQEDYERAWLDADSEARTLAVQLLSIIITGGENKVALAKYFSDALCFFCELQERGGELKPAFCHDLGGIYTIWACQEFYEAGYHSHHLSRFQIWSRALQLWSEVHRWGPRKDETLLDVNTSRLFDDLGVRVKSGYPNGRPTKETFPPGNPEDSEFIWEAKGRPQSLPRGNEPIMRTDLGLSDLL
jgi:hypothetical protein